MIRQANYTKDKLKGFVRSIKDKGDLRARRIRHGNKFKNLFCSRPFEYCDIGANGVVSLCCPGWLPYNIGDLNGNTLMQVWNSKKAQKIRKSILDGSYQYCIEKYCPFLQTDGLLGFREIEDRYLADVVSKKILSLEKGPKILELNYDRTCNLFCRSCRTEPFSLTGEQLNRARVFQYEIIQPALKDVNELVVTGSGDPLASRLHREFLQNLDSRQYPQLRIDLFTNGLLLTPMMWESLHNIHPAIYRIRISMDAATEHTYRLNRRGGNFNKLLENLGFIKNLRTGGDIEEFILLFVVQKNNYPEMEKFIELGKKFNCDNVIFSKIRNWGTYTKKEFSEIAVHENSHPEHNRFLEVLKNPVFKDPFVLMLDLNPFLNET